MVRLISSIRQLPTTQYFDPLLLTLSMLFINHFSNKFICYTQRHVLGLFLVLHSAPSFSFGCSPSPLAWMYFMAWQEEPFEVSGALVGRTSPRRKPGKTPQSTEGLRDHPAFGFWLPFCFHMCHLYKTQQLGPKTDEVRQRTWQSTLLS